MKHIRREHDNIVCGNIIKIRICFASIGNKAVIFSTLLRTKQWFKKSKKKSKYFFYRFNLFTFSLSKKRNEQAVLNN